MKLRNLIYLLGAYTLFIPDILAGDNNARKDDHNNSQEFHHHHLGIFNGYARKDTKKRKDGYKIGVEYEYQFTNWIGLRGFVDYEAGDLEKWLYGVGPSLHVSDTGLVLFAGVGIEKHGGKDEGFFRLDVEYQIHVSDELYLAPTVGYDFGRRGKGASFAGVMLGVSF